MGLVRALADISSLFEGVDSLENLQCIQTVTERTSVEMFYCFELMWFIGTTSECSFEEEREAWE